MRILRVIAIVVQILGGILAIVKTLLDIFVVGVPPISLPGSPIQLLAIGLYAYITYDFADAWYFGFRDWRRVVCTAALAFVVLTAIVNPVLWVILLSFGIAAIAALVAVFNPSLGAFNQGTANLSAGW
jgi:hypothetical protein